MTCGGVARRSVRRSFTSGDATLIDRTALAIEINRRAILRVVRTMLSMMPEAGSAGGIVTRAVWLTVLSMLRPAESAARRLIALMALHMAVLPLPPQEKRERKRRERKETGSSAGLPLFDRRTRPGEKRKKRKGRKPDPRIRDPLVDRPIGGEPHRPPLPDDPIDPARLLGRIDALARALGDIPALALRLARIHAEKRTRWPYAIRPGRPPGFRKRGKRPVDEILADCNGLFWMAVRRMERPP